MTWFAWEVSLLWAGVGLYLVSLVLYAHAVLFAHPERTRWGAWAAAAGLLPHGAGIVVRWVATGHGPYMLKHEVLASNAWIAIAIMLAFLARRTAWSAIALVVVPAAILMMGLGLFSDPAIRDLPPTLRSMWLVFHITFAKLAGGAFLLSVASAIFLLLRGRGVDWAWLSRVPATAGLDALTVRAIGFGFIFWTVSVAAGSIWANESWGRYWGWDAVETWSLVTWLVYGTFLHAKLFFRLKPIATAWSAVAAFAIFILTILILPFLIPSLHSAYFQ